MKVYFHTFMKKKSKGIFKKSEKRFPKKSGKNSAKAHQKIYQVKATKQDLVRFL